MALMWLFGDFRPEPVPEIIATDADEKLLERARRGCYAPSSLRELPQVCRTVFDPKAEGQCLRPEYRSLVLFEQQNIRVAVPEGRFDLILCRNLAFTYFSSKLQISIAQRLTDILVPGGLLLLGSHESLPELADGMELVWTWLYRRRVP